jgi:hypothetical protein
LKPLLPSHLFRLAASSLAFLCIPSRTISLPLPFASFASSICIDLFSLRAPSLSTSYYSSFARVFTLSCHPSSFNTLPLSLIIYNFHHPPTLFQSFCVLPSIRLPFLPSSRKPRTSLPSPLHTTFLFLTLIPPTLSRTPPACLAQLSLDPSALSASFAVAAVFFTILKCIQHRKPTLKQEGKSSESSMIGGPKRSKQARGENGRSIGIERGWASNGLIASSGEGWRETSRRR